MPMGKYSPSFNEPGGACSVQLRAYSLTEHLEAY